MQRSRVWIEPARLFDVFARLEQYRGAGIAQYSKNRMTCVCFWKLR
jgi:hypothetical protein